MLAHILITLYAVLAPGLLLPAGTIRIPVDDIATCWTWVADEESKIVVEGRRLDIAYECVDEPTSSYVDEVDAPAEPPDPGKPV
ncbi:MAG: hypothetical protein AB7G13_30240 [Lautropia sp.]